MQEANKAGTRKSAQLKQKSCKAESEGFRVVIEKASLVQLVERRSPKPDVEGSSPSGRDLYKRVNGKQKIKFPIHLFTQEETNEHSSKRNYDILKRC